MDWNVRMDVLKNVREMVVNIIHNPLNKTRHKILMNELSSQGITHFSLNDNAVHKYTIVDAIMAPENSSNKDIVTCIGKSHQKALQQGKHPFNDYTIIAEDDVRFLKSDSFQHFIDGIELLPDDWDVYLSGVYTMIGWKNFNGFRSVNDFAALHLYAVRQKFYDKFMSYEGGDHFDRWIGGKGGAKCYVRYPFSAIQHNGFSDQRKMNCNDDYFIKNFEVYGR